MPEVYGSRAYSDAIFVGKVQASTVSEPITWAGTGAGSVIVGLSSAAGTDPTLDIWLQGSNDGGTTWADVYYAQGNVTGTAAATVYGVSVRNINGGSAATTTGTFYAAYYTLPGMLRMKWTLGGTSEPSFDVTAYVRG